MLQNETRKAKSLMQLRADAWVWEKHTFTDLFAQNVNNRYILLVYIDSLARNVDEGYSANLVVRREKLFLGWTSVFGAVNWAEALILQSSTIDTWKAVTCLSIAGTWRVQSTFAKVEKMHTIGTTTTKCHWLYRGKVCLWNLSKEHIAKYHHCGRGSSICWQRKICIQAVLSWPHRMSTTTLRYGLKRNFDSMYFH